MNKKDKNLINDENKPPLNNLLILSQSEKMIEKDFYSLSREQYRSFG